MGKEGRGRKAASGRGGERGRAAGEGAGAAAAGLPRLPSSVRPALARPLLVLLPAWLASPQLPALAAPPPALRAGVTLPPSSCASASFHTNTNSSTRAQISPPPPHSAPARPRETSARTAARPASIPLAVPGPGSSLSTNRAGPLVLEAPPTHPGSSRLGPLG